MARDEEQEKERQGRVVTVVTAVLQGALDRPAPDWRRGSVARVLFPIACVVFDAIQASARPPGRPAAAAAARPDRTGAPRGSCSVWSSPAGTSGGGVAGRERPRGGGGAGRGRRGRAPAFYLALAATGVTAAAAAAVAYLATAHRPRLFPSRPAPPRPVGRALRGGVRVPLAAGVRAAGAAGAPVAAALALAGALLFFECDRARGTGARRPRAPPFVYALLQTALAALRLAVDGRGVPLRLAVLLVALAMLALHTTMQPYLRAAMNELRCGLFAAVAAAALLSCLIPLAGEPGSAAASAPPPPACSSSPPPPPAGPSSAAVPTPPRAAPDLAERAARCTPHRDEAEAAEAAAALEAAAAAAAGADPQTPGGQTPGGAVVLSMRGAGARGAAAGGQRTMKDLREPEVGAVDSPWVASRGFWFDACLDAAARRPLETLSASDGGAECAELVFRLGCGTRTSPTRPSWRRRGRLSSSLLRDAPGAIAEARRAARKAKDASDFDLKVLAIRRRQAWEQAASGQGSGVNMHEFRRMFELATAAHNEALSALKTLWASRLRHTREGSKSLASFLPRRLGPAGAPSRPGAAAQLAKSTRFSRDSLATVYKRVATIHAAKRKAQEGRAVAGGGRSEKSGSSGSSRRNRRGASTLLRSTASNAGALRRLKVRPPPRRLRFRCGLAPPARLEAHRPPPPPRPFPRPYARPRRRASGACRWAGRRLCLLAALYGATFAVYASRFTEGKQVTYQIYAVQHLARAYELFMYYARILNTAWGQSWLGDGAGVEAARAAVAPLLEESTRWLRGLYLGFAEPPVPPAAAPALWAFWRDEDVPLRFHVSPGGAHAGAAPSPSPSASASGGLAVHKDASPWAAFNHYQDAFLAVRPRSSPLFLRVPPRAPGRAAVKPGMERLAEPAGATRSGGSCRTTGAGRWWRRWSGRALYLAEAVARKADHDAAVGAMLRGAPRRTMLIALRGVAEIVARIPPDLISHISATYGKADLVGDAGDSEDEQAQLLAGGDAAGGNLTARSRRSEATAAAPGTHRSLNGEPGGSPLLPPRWPRRRWTRRRTAPSRGAAGALALRGPSFRSASFRSPSFRSPSFARRAAEAAAAGAAAEGAGAGAGPSQVGPPQERLHQAAAYVSRAQRSLSFHWEGALAEKPPAPLATLSDGPEATPPPPAAPGPMHRRRRRAGEEDPLSSLLSSLRSEATRRSSCWRSAGRGRLAPPRAPGAILRHRGGPARLREGAAAARSDSPAPGPPPPLPPPPRGARPSAPSSAPPAPRRPRRPSLGPRARPSQLDPAPSPLTPKQANAYAAAPGAAEGAARGGLRQRLRGHLCGAGRAARAVSDGSDEGEGEGEGRGRRTVAEDEEAAVLRPGGTCPDGAAAHEEGPASSAAAGAGAGEEAGEKAAVEKNALDGVFAALTRRYSLGVRGAGGGLDFAAHLFASGPAPSSTTTPPSPRTGGGTPRRAARADPPAPFYDGDFIAQRSGAGEGLRRLEGYRPALDAGFGRAGALFLAEADRVAALVAAVQAAFFVVGTLFLFFLYVGMFRGMIARLGDESSRASQFLETIPGTCRAQLPQFFGADDPAAAP
eukprot:tig00001542_g9310.t1